MLDVSLPGMPGLERQRRVQAHGFAPIIITTAVRGGGVRQAAGPNG